MSLCKLSRELQEKYSRDFLRKPNPTRLRPTTHFTDVLGPRQRPSSPDEGDRDQQRFDLGGMAISPSSFLFISLFLFLLFLTTRSDGFESPPTSLPFPSFRFTPHPSDLVLYSGDLLEAMGDSRLHRLLSFCRHESAIPVRTETIDSNECSENIGSGEFFQLILLSTLFLGLII